jgi:aspartyl-tRNA(Asn)/glutamyl-tRNA(Gln) amidotransferase subunit C
MAITEDQVRTIARLARVAINESEIPEFQTQISRILAFVAQMDAVDTAGIAPLAHPQEVAGRTRPDEVTEIDRRVEFQAVAPLTGNGLYLVPKMIE